MHSCSVQLGTASIPVRFLSTSFRPSIVRIFTAQDWRPLAFPSAVCYNPEGLWYDCGCTILNDIIRTYDVLDISTYTYHKPSSMQL